MATDLNADTAKQTVALGEQDGLAIANASPVDLTQPDRGSRRFPGVPGCESGHGNQPDSGWRLHGPVAGGSLWNAGVSGFRLQWMSKLHEIEVHRLRPTQITVGMIEVNDKREKLESLKHHDLRDFLAAHPVPAVWGPEDRLYITDHHHLGRAATDAGIKTGFFCVEEDFSKLDCAEFWKRMREVRWAHPIDESGRHCHCDDIPHHLSKLRDDVYRSLAGYVRNAGGYEKTPTAFAEFLWADFLRTRIVVGPTRADFDHAVKQALKLASSPEAAKLPGYVASRR